MPNLEVIGLQSTAFEMNLNGLITDKEFSILEALTECMTTNTDALELTTTLTMENLEDQDVTDCIIARKFATAMMILY
jgi:hypothetical protein